MFEISGF